MEKTPGIYLNVLDSYGLEYEFFLFYRPSNVVPLQIVDSERDEIGGNLLVLYEFGDYLDFVGVVMAAIHDALDDHVGLITLIFIFQAESLYDTLIDF